MNYTPNRGTRSIEETSGRHFYLAVEHKGYAEKKLDITVRNVFSTVSPSHAKLHTEKVKQGAVQVWLEQPLSMQSHVLPTATELFHNVPVAGFSRTF